MAEESDFAVRAEGGAVSIQMARVQDVRPALKAIGFHLVKQTQRAFRLQKRGPYEWPERAVPNIAGVISDLQKGTSVKGRRWDPRPALVDRGILARSWDYRIIGDTMVQVGTSVEYASTHQQGGKTTLRIDQGVRENLAQAIKGDDRLKELGWIFQTDSREIDVARRVMLYITARDKRRYREIGARWILFGEL